MPHSHRTDKEKDSRIVVRLSMDLHSQFKSILKSEDKNQSEVMREFIKMYIAEKKQKTLF